MSPLSRCPTCRCVCLSYGTPPNAIAARCRTWRHSWVRQTFCSAVCVSFFAFASSSVFLYICEAHFAPIPNTHPLLCQNPTLSSYVNTQPHASWTKIPFEIPGGRKDIETARLAATKSLGQVPTAHTCDNILELPNYWMLLMRHDGRDEKTQLSDVSVRDVSLVVLDEGLNTPTTWSQPHGVYVGCIRRPNGIDDGERGTIRTKE